LLRRLFPHTGRAILIGVTGAAGSGKSTLVNGLAVRLQQRSKSVGIVAVDPTSPFSGGALLGDRVRMPAAESGAFIRSMATRGAAGGLSAATLDAAMVLDAAGKDFILIETVGVGQDEVAIAGLADVVLLVLVPQAGDEIQALKAGIMEIADILVLNKADLPGVEQLEAALRATLESSPEPRRPAIVRTVATSGEGLEQLLDEASDYLERAQEDGSFRKRRVKAWGEQIVERARRRVLERLQLSTGGKQLLEQQAAAVERREMDPHGAAEQLLKQAGWNAQQQ
jgi:LAO/AO transport system kinase